VNYTEAIMRDVLTRGVIDPDIQLDLLGDKNQNMSLEEVFQFVETKEAGKRSASRLLDAHSVEAASSYRRAKQTPSKDNQEACSYCGKRGHGKKSVAQIRKTQCPAYGHRCELCYRDNHFESVCRSKDNPKRQAQPKPRNYDKESAVFDSLCTLNSSKSQNDEMNTINAHKQKRQQQSVPLDHHMYDSMTDTWVRRN